MAHGGSQEVATIERWDGSSFHVNCVVCLVRMLILVAVRYLTLLQGRVARDPVWLVSQVKRYAYGSRFRFFGEGVTLPSLLDDLLEEDKTNLIYEFCHHTVGKCIADSRQWNETLRYQ